MNQEGALRPQPPPPLQDEPSQAELEHLKKIEEKDRELDALVHTFAARSITVDLDSFDKQNLIEFSDRIQLLQTLARANNEAGNRLKGHTIRFNTFTNSVVAYQTEDGRFVISIPLNLTGDRAKHELLDALDNEVKAKYKLVRSPAARLFREIKNTVDGYRLMAIDARNLSPEDAHVATQNLYDALHLVSGGNTNKFRSYRVSFLSHEAADKESAHYPFPTRTLLLSPDDWQDTDRIVGLLESSGE